MTETACPLCQTPRPRGAKRCICNYTFEYESPPRHSFRPPSTGRFDAIVLIVAVGAAMIAGFLANGLEHAQVPDSAVAWFMIAAGVFSIAGGVFGWRWFLANRRARWPRLLLGTEGARVFYGMLGGALAGGGIALVLV